MHECYNVRAYVSPVQTNSNFIQEIRNELVNTILRKVILPQRIIIMLSSAKLNDPVFSIECMEGLLRWLLDEIEDILKFQKRCLPEKSKKLDAPRVYFLKILPKPSGCPGNNLFKGVRRKFNSTLQDMLESYRGFGFINVHEITTRIKDERFFISPESGILSDEGAIQLWDSISQTLKAIDFRLKPKSITKDQFTQWEIKDQKRAEHLEPKTRDRSPRINKYRHNPNSYQSQEQHRYNNNGHCQGRPYYSNSYYY